MITFLFRIIPGVKSTNSSLGQKDDDHTKSPQFQFKKEYGEKDFIGLFIIAKQNNPYSVQSINVG
jgi:hypothetical protein